MLKILTELGDQLQEKQYFILAIQSVGTGTSNAVGSQLIEVAGWNCSQLIGVEVQKPALSR